MLIQQPEDSVAVFAVIVEADMRGGGNAEHAQYLRDPENNAQWREVLVSMLDDVRSQLSRKEADFVDFSNKCYGKGPSGTQEFHVGKAKYANWKANAISRIASIERSLREVKRRRREAFIAQRGDREERRARWALLTWAGDLISMEGLGEDWHRAFNKLKGRDSIGKD